MHGLEHNKIDVMIITKFDFSILLIHVITHDELIVETGNKLVGVGNY